MLRQREEIGDWQRLADWAERPGDLMVLVSIAEARQEDEEKIFPFPESSCSQMELDGILLPF